MKYVLAVLLAFIPPLSAAAISGTRTIGPNSADYLSLTAAIADIQSESVGGALILELQADYLSTAETFPLVIPALNGASATNTVTIRPASGATALSIASATTSAATVDLNGVQFVIFDGRAGGTGTAKELTIANTSTSGRAVRFISDASRNILRHLTLQSVNTSANSGTVVFSTSAGGSGNDNNTLDSCDLRDGASTPKNCIYSSNLPSLPDHLNSGNTITNCNLFNFYGGSGDAAGIRIVGGNTDWTISGNSFYQTVARAATNANVRAIYVDTTSGNNFTISDNRIGGSAPNAGGTSWTTTGNASCSFQGIQLNAGMTTPSRVSGNTIGNMVWTSSSSASVLPGVWSGIYVQAGAAEIATGNIIGSGTGTGSVFVTTSGSGGTTYGIGSASLATVVIDNNVIGSITTNHTSTGAASLCGILVTGGANTISNNLVGSTTTANSLNAATSTTTAAASSAQQVTGIFATYGISTASSSASITGNTVANLNNNYNSTGAGQISGIETSSGVNAIIGNTVRNLSTSSPSISYSYPASVIGISQSAAEAGQTVSRNVVHSLTNTAATARVRVTGIYYSGSTSTGPNLIERNLVHSLSIASTGTPMAYGMYFDAGTFTAQNNMVRVGIDAAGADTAGAATVFGIYESGNSAGRNFYHNSVYVGGSQISGSTFTFAFASADTNSTRDFRNNIFVNARSNGGASGKHYAVAYSSSPTVNPAGLTAGGNLFFASGTGGTLGIFNNTDCPTLAAWQAATGQDVSSAVADPLFVNPTGDAASVDLHLQAGSPAEGGGLPVVSVPDDYDGQTRASLTPVDIGADSGNQNSTGDFNAPSISYPLLSSGSTSNRTLTGWARIEDNSGYVASGAAAPRLYYKKATDDDVFGGNTVADNGWKYVTATGNSSPYSFMMDYSILNGGSVSVGDHIQYFVVAQDEGDHLASNPAAATASNAPPVRNINGKPAAGVNSYSIISSLDDTVTVGPAGIYPSLSGAGGLFAALKSNVLTGNLTVNLTGDTSEDGSTVLNATMQDDYPSTFTVTLQPDSATMRTISGASAIGLIRLSGAERLTIDGSFGGNGRYLTFRNTNTNGPTISFVDDASNNTVRNCVVEGAAGSSSGGGVSPDNSCVVLFGTGVVTGNDNNVVTGNQIRDRSDAVGVPGYLLLSRGSSDEVANSNNTVSNNELFNFGSYGVYVKSGSDSWSITSNEVYQTEARTTILSGIMLSLLGSSTVSGNIVHDLTTANSAAGISLAIEAGNINVSSNRIWNIGNTAGSGYATGIYLGSGGTGKTVTIANNMVTLGISGVSSQYLWGIRDTTALGSTVMIVHNTVLITGIGALWDSWACNQSGNSNTTVKNNVFLNLRVALNSANRCNHFAFNRDLESVGSLNMDFNVYSGTGETSVADFFGRGSGTPISFAQWKVTLMCDLHSSASNPGGNYTSAMFVDAANGDLHLVPGGNPLVNNTGTPISGLDFDCDGQPRSALQPYIGADELPAPSNQVPIFSGYAVSTPTDTAVDISHAALLARASDPDGGNLAIISVATSSAQGGAVANSGEMITYNPPTGYTGLDVFTLTVSDNQGGEIPATVMVNITDVFDPSGNQIQIAVFQNGEGVGLLFNGVPGQSYLIQRSTDLVNWSFVKSVTATNNGVVPFSDTDPPKGSAFYRATQP